MNEAFASGASLEMGSVRKAKSSTFSLAESLRQLAYDWKEGLGCIMGFGSYDYKWLCTQAAAGRPPDSLGLGLEATEPEERPRSLEAERRNAGARRGRWEPRNLDCGR